MTKAKKLMHPMPIPQSMLEALNKWAKAYGEKKWKAALRIAWIRGGDRDPVYSPYLQQLRNQYGPAWLTLVKDDLSNVLTIDGVVKDADGNVSIVSYKTEADR